MENFKKFLFKKLSNIKHTYSKLSDCNGSFEILADDNCRFSIKPLNKNDYEELKLNKILTCFDTQKSTDLKNYSFYETTCQYLNNQIIFEYRNIPFGAINIKQEDCIKRYEAMKKYEI